jgi:hypothetical protein
MKKLEEVDPELAEMIINFCNSRRKPIMNKIGRNDPCPFCLTEGLKIKWKKCNLHNHDK